MNHLFLNLLLLSPVGALVLGITALAIPARRRMLSVLVPTIGTLWGVAGIFGFIAGARHFHLLHEAGQEVDYVFDTQKMRRDTLVAAGVSLAITTIPLLVLRRNRRRSLSARS